MARYVLTRLGSALLVLAVASVGIFGLIRVVPGDPVSVLAGPDATAESRAAIRAELGLDQPFWGQYVAWLGDLVRLDLGPSYRLGGDVGALVADAVDQGTGDGGAGEAHVATDGDLVGLEVNDEGAADAVGDIGVEFVRYDASNVVGLEQVSDWGVVSHGGCLLASSIRSGSHVRTLA